MLLFALLITSAEVLLYGPFGWFEHEYTKYDCLSNLNEEMTMESALIVTDEYMSYLRGVRGTLVVYIERGGTEQEFFTDREKAHMADVRKLFMGGLRLRNLCVAGCIAAALFLIYNEKKRMSGTNWTPASSAKEFVSCFSNPPKETLSALGKAYIATSTVTAFLLAAFAALAAADFGSVFFKFHTIFFNNDLWLLDPAKDDLINLLPEGFFSDTVKIIAIIFISASVIILIPAIKAARKAPIPEASKQMTKSNSFR